MAKSVDLRERVVAEVEEGLSCHQAAARFGIAVSSVIKGVQRFLETGSDATPLPVLGHAPEARGERPEHASGVNI